MMDLQDRMNIKIENSSPVINVMDKALPFNLDTFFNTVARLLLLIKVKESLYK